MPKSLSNFISRIMCDTLSNAFLKSIKATATTKPASTAFLHVSVVVLVAVLSKILRVMKRQKRPICALCDSARVGLWILLGHFGIS